MKYRYLRARVEGGFWRAYQDLVRNRVLTYQWKALNDLIPEAPPSHSIENFKVAAGLSDGAYDGMVFQDSDLAKWLEAAGHALADDSENQAELRSWVDGAVDLVARAQQADGYLNTYFTINDHDRRWTNLREAHELYVAGHFIEAGVAVYRGTGDRKLLDVVCRLADHIDNRFSPSRGKKTGYPGHEEVELALMKLYRATGESRYLSLAMHFVGERGKTPSYFEEESMAPGYVPVFGIKLLDYYQAHQPVAEQCDAVGHAVRAMYLCTAMADLALETDNQELGAACERLWQSATGKRMYVTGGIGSSAQRESFTADYDLPSDTAYAETCAAIGLFVFSHRMAVYRNIGSYVDVMERTLYNGILSGLSLDGQSYFYVNPLEVVPELCDKNPGFHHVKYRRQPWYGCACCPPNIARLLASLGEYLYHQDSTTLYVDLFHTGTLHCRIGNKDITVRQKTDYPWDGTIRLELGLEGEQAFTLALRIPGWCANPAVTVNDEQVSATDYARDGYLRISRSWNDSCSVELTLPMDVQRLHSHPRVRATFGKVAIQRGPIIYCLEEVDNGPDLHTIVLPPDAELTPLRDESLLGGAVTLRARGYSTETLEGEPPLYACDGRHTRLAPRELRFVPYYAWANRDAGEMRVWILQAAPPGSQM